MLAAKSFYYSKYIEYLDTAWLVLKGKPVSFLQTFHHFGAPWDVYLGLVSGATVRHWAQDFISVERWERGADGEPRAMPKEKYTFSPWRIGGHTEWLLTNEGS